MSGAEIAGQIAAAYDEAGRAAGNGEGALMAMITRPGAPTGPAHAPTMGPPTTHTFTAKPADQRYTQRTGTALATGERAYSLVNHQATIAPTTADTLTVDGKTASIIEVIPMDAAGFTLTWMVKVQT